MAPVACCRNIILQHAVGDGGRSLCYRFISIFLIFVYVLCVNVFLVHVNKETTFKKY